MDRESNMIQSTYLRGGFGSCVENQIMGKWIVERDGGAQATQETPVESGGWCFPWADQDSPSKNPNEDRT